MVTILPLMVLVKSTSDTKETVVASIVQIVSHFGQWKAQTCFHAALELVYINQNG